MNRVAGLTAVLFSIWLLGNIATVSAQAPTDGSAKNSQSQERVEFSPEQQQDLLQRLVAFPRGKIAAKDLFDLDAARELVILKTGLHRESLVKIMKDDLDYPKDGGALASYRNMIGPKDRVDLLRIRKRDDQTVAQLRLLSADGGFFTYLEFAVGPPTASGKLMVIDVYNFEKGEWVSQQEAWGVTFAMNAVSETAVEKVTGRPSRTAQDSEFLKQFSEHRNKNQAKKALECLESLSESLRDSIRMQLERVRLAVSLKDEKLEKTTLESLKRRFPDHPAVNLLSLGLHQATKEYDLALADVAAIDRYLGGDPYLDVVRAEIFLGQEKFSESIAAAQNALKRDASLEQAHKWIIAAAVTNKDYASLSSTLKSLADKGKTTIKKIESTKGFAEYVASPEFKAWKAESQARSEAKK